MFCNCTNLTDIIISESVENINFRAFESCINLKIINLPNNLTLISENVFNKCKKLNQIIIENDNILGDNPYIIRCDEPHNLRMATGNEPNAWQDEWCPCGVTRDGTNEAVIDPMEKGDYSFKHVFGDDEWHK